jgi:hypothetical protein
VAIKNKIMDRGIFQVLWEYLDPITQFRIRSVCKDFNEWSKKWPTRLWNITKLLEKGERDKISGKKWFYWGLENTRIKVKFLSPHFNVIDSIELYYFISKLNCKSKIICTLNGGKCVKQGKPLYGKKYDIFNCYARILKNWQPNMKIRRRLFSCCKHLVRGQSKMSITYDLKFCGAFKDIKDYYECGYCIKHKNEEGLECLLGK